jgi:hypothetical protein
MSYNEKPDLKLMGITKRFLAELHELLHHAFDLYSSYKNNTTGEFVMSYDELQSFYLSFKEEFNPEIEFLNNNRLQKQVEDFRKVEYIYIDKNVNEAVLMFHLEDNMDETVQVQYVMRHQESMPQEDLPQEVITEAKFILGFERLIFRIYNEYSDNSVMNITERFKQWLIKMIEIKKKEREIQEQIRKTQSEKEDVEREIRHIKEMAENLGYYYALKAYSEGPIDLSELLYAENLWIYEKPIEIFLKPSDFQVFVNDFLEFDKQMPHRLRSYVISEKAESEKILYYRDLVRKAKTANDRELVMFESNLRKNHFTICFNTKGEYKIGISPDSLYDIIVELLQFYKEEYGVVDTSVHVITFLYNRVFTTENTGVISQRIAERYKALLTAVREKNAAEARKQQEEREKIRKENWWKYGGQRKKTFRKKKSLKKSGKTKRSKKNRKTNKKK